MAGLARTSAAGHLHLLPYRMPWHWRSCAVLRLRNHAGAATTAIKLAMRRHGLVGSICRTCFSKLVTAPAARHQAARSRDGLDMLLICVQAGMSIEDGRSARSAKEISGQVDRALRRSQSDHGRVVFLQDPPTGLRESWQADRSIRRQGDRRRSHPGRAMGLHRQALRVMAKEHPISDGRRREEGRRIATQTDRPMINFFLPAFCLW